MLCVFCRFCSFDVRRCVLIVVCWVYGLWLFFLCVVCCNVNCRALFVGFVVV